MFLLGLAHAIQCINHNPPLHQHLINDEAVTLFCNINTNANITDNITTPATITIKTIHTLMYNSLIEPPTSPQYLISTHRQHSTTRHISAITILYGNTLHRTPSTEPPTPRTTGCSLLTTLNPRNEPPLYIRLSMTTPHSQFPSRPSQQRAPNGSGANHFP